MEPRPCKFHWLLLNIKKGLGLSKLADIVLSLINPSPCYVKVNTVQEAYVNCFAVHISIKICILKNHMKQNETKNIRLLFFSFSSIDLGILVFSFVFSCCLQDFKF